MTLAGVLPAGQYAVVIHVGPFGQLVEAVRKLLHWAAERGRAWDKPRAFFGLIGEAVWWVTIVDGTLVRHHLKPMTAYWESGLHKSASGSREPWRGLRYATGPLRTAC